MSQKAQGIRPTQFVTSYGPGTILEGINGPRVVVSFERSGLFGAQQIHTYEITEPALRQILEDGGRIFRIPTNADLNRPDQEPIYDTIPFPRWSLCVRHHVLYNHEVGTKRTCPQCEVHPDKYRAWETSRNEAVSLVLACPNGHLDEIYWPSLLHRAKSCPSKTFLWKARGSSLRHVTIECMECKESLNLGAEYLMEHSCRGRFPERNEQEACEAKARIVQRGAANVYRTQLVSSVTVPRSASPLTRALEHSALVNLIHLVSATALRQMLPTLVGIPKPIKDEILAASDDELEASRTGAHQQTSPLTTEQARLMEFGELQKAATEGYRAEPSRSRCSPSEFEVDRGKVRQVEHGGLTFRVTPVQRLRVVMVQTGYTRMEGKQVVSSAYRNGAELWYPGVELFGEGIFLDLDLGDFAGPHWSRWQGMFAATGQATVHPAFVWWHTLAHRLIRSLSIHSGYSSASVRERVYLQVDAANRGQGGLLLYAVQPGGDGTLGGLIALVPRFERILSEALDDLDICSNDPFCEETRPRESSPNGAACYACCLTSETSCEHRNSSLDRNLLKETLL